MRLLNQNGWTDGAIARAFGVTQHTIYEWRKRNGIPSAYLPNRVDAEKATRLYAQGCNDHEIAKEIGVVPSAICVWRRNRSLPSNVQNAPLSSEMRRMARKLLRRGATKQQVADVVGCSKMTIQSIRASMPKKGLRTSGITNQVIRRRVRRDKTIWPRIEAAIGDNLPVHIREEAVHEMYADIFDGRLAADQIEKQAASYRSKAYDMCGSKFGPVSLDAENENGLTLAERIADPSQFNWDEV